MVFIFVSLRILRFGPRTLEIVTTTTEIGNAQSDTQTDYTNIYSRYLFRQPNAKLFVNTLKEEEKKEKESGMIEEKRVYKQHRKLDRKRMVVRLEE